MNERNRAILNAVAPPRIIRFFLAIFLISVLVLTLLRVGFLLRHFKLAAGIPFSTLLHSFVIGARFDVVVLSYGLIPLFLLSYVPLIGMDRLKATRVIIVTVFLATMGLVFLLSFVDIEFFSEFGTRLSGLVWEYLDHADMIWYSVLSGYPVLPYFLLWGAMTFAFALAVTRISRAIFRERRREGIWVRFSYFALCSGLLVLGARGRWQLAPIDWGTAYFSPYGFADQLALNGVYTLGKSYWDDSQHESGEILRRYHYFPSSQALSTVQRLLANPKEQLSDSAHSLARWYYPGTSNSKIRDYNVVIIQLESWLARYVGALGGKPDATPNFDSLSGKGVLLEHCYATGTRTNRGIVSNLCAFPSQTGHSIMKRYCVNRPFDSIAEILRKRGYPNIVVYGGDLQFDNMEGFLRNQGFDTFIGQEDFPPGSKLGKWGVPDHLMFERANEEFAKFGDKPFLGVIVTVSNHEPYLLPSPRFEIFPKDVPQSEFLNTFYYSDWALGEFFREAEKEPYFKNTIFVLVADHGKFMESQIELPVDRFHIACLIYAPYILGDSPRRISTVASQTDLIPTILGILGRPAFHQSWGRDLLSLSSEDKGFAMMIDGNLVGWMEGPYFLVERTGVSSSLYNISDDPLQKHDLFLELPEVSEGLQAKERSFLQLSTEAASGQKAPAP
ncbi:MAG: LTA synthase family protein [Candidatus Zixiibacteriota bacterium]